MDIRIVHDLEIKDPPPMDYLCQKCGREVATWAGRLQGLWVCHYCKAGKSQIYLRSVNKK